MIQECVSTFWVRIYISGDIVEIKRVCQREVMRGLCVTVDATTFIYTCGREEGAVIGLINYPRFPSLQDAVWGEAIQLATKLRSETFQRSVLVMSPDKTLWISDETVGR